MFQLSEITDVCYCPQNSMMVKRAGSGTVVPGFKSWLCCLLAMTP